MKNKLGYILVFAAGAAVGVGATWQYFKTKYEQIAQEEIDSVKEKFSNRNNEEVEDGEDCLDDFEPKTIKTKPSINEYAAILAKNSYIDYTNVEDNQVKKKEVETVMEDGRPYVISPDDCGEISFTYYADGVLADDADDPLSEEEIENIVGSDFASYFGEYEQDSVFIRNDALKTDYEILMDERRYDDIYTIHQN